MQVYFLAGKKDTEELVQICTPLALQIVSDARTKTKVLHMAARNRIIDQLRLMSDLLGSSFLLDLAAKAFQTPDKIELTLVFDTDQEATEQRMLRSLTFVLPAVTRLGIHHRLSNCCGGNKIITELKVALRIFSGGRVASKSLRGGFHAALASLSERVKNGFEPAQKTQIQREMGCALEDAFDDGTSC